VAAEAEPVAAGRRSRRRCYRTFESAATARRFFQRERCRQIRRSSSASAPGSRPSW
jgi:hypothetical protein